LAQAILAQAVLHTYSTYNLVLTTLAYDTMSVVKLGVLVTLRLLSLAAGVHLQTQRGQDTDLTALDPATCVEAVVVEPRKMKSMGTALLSAVRAKKSHFNVFTIAHGQTNGNFVKAMVRNDTTLNSLKQKGKLRFRSLPFDDLGGDKTADPDLADPGRIQMEADLEHHDQYSRVLKSKEFWNGFTCDRILLLQSDTTLCSNANWGLEHFSMYEYIGGRNAHAGERDYLPGRMHLNGGFSFRNRNGMLRCIDAVGSMNSTWQALFNRMPEDAFYSNCVELKQPAIGRLKAFSIDGGAYKMDENIVPFGVHKPWQEASCNGCRFDNMRFCGGAIELLWDYDPERAEWLNNDPKAPGCCKRP